MLQLFTDKSICGILCADWVEDGQCDSIMICVMGSDCDLDRTSNTHAIYFGISTEVERILVVLRIAAMDVR